MLGPHVGVSETVKSGPRGVAFSAGTDIWLFTGNGEILFSSNYPRFKIL